MIVWPRGRDQKGEMVLPRPLGRHERERDMVNGEVLTGTWCLQRCGFYRRGTRINTDALMMGV